MRTKNYIKIIISSTILQLVVAISGIILPRFFIKYYGSEINGLIVSIKQIITYFSFVSLGLGAASSAALYEPLEKKDSTKISSILSATRTFFNRTGYIFLVLVFLLTVIYPFAINAPLSKINIALIVLILGGGGVLEYIIITKYRILLIADQKNNIVSRITTQGVILNTSISIILIISNAPLILIQFVTVSIYLFRLLLTKKYVKKNYPNIDFNYKPDFSLIPNRKDAFIYQLPNMIMTYTPIMIVTFFLGLKMVSIYSVYNMIYFSLAMIVGVFSAGINGIFGNIHAKKDVVLLKDSFNEFSFIYRVISFSLFLSALILTIPFLKIYIDSIDSADYLIKPLAYGFALFGLLRILRIPSVTVIEVAGHFKQNKALNYLEIAIMIIGSLIFIKDYGIVGILFSSAFASLIRTIAYIVYTKKIIDLLKLKKEVMIFIANFALFFGLKIIIDELLPINNVSSFMTWFLYAFLMFTIISLSFLTFNVILDYSVFRKLLSRINNIFSKKKHSNY